jgi:hypothetical protein
MAAADPQSFISQKVANGAADPKYSIGQEVEFAGDYGKKGNGVITDIVYIVHYEVTEPYPSGIRHSANASFVPRKGTASEIVVASGRIKEDINKIAKYIPSVITKITAEGGYRKRTHKNNSRRRRSTRRRH